MSDYEFYFTVFHALMGLISLMGIVWLTASSERYVKTYTTHEHIHKVVRHEYAIETLACSVAEPIYEPKAIDYKGYVKHHISRVLAENLMPYIEMDESKDMYQREIIHTGRILIARRINE